MIEKEVSQLDQDFITIWSYYVLCGINNNHVEQKVNIDITKLAEQGQINAIQSYYLFNQPGNNKVIDEQVLDLEYKLELNFNEKLALANYYESLERTQQDKQDLYNEIKSKIDAKEYDRSFGYLQEKLKEYKSFQYFKDAYLDAKSEYEKTQNPLVGQRAIEMKNGIYYLLINIFVVKEIDNSPFKNTKRQIKEVYRRLMKEYKSDSSNELIKYALGKNIVLYQPYYFNVDKEVYEFGKGLLKELADRYVVALNNSKPYVRK